MLFRFGDLYPQKAFEGFDRDPIAAMKMCFTVAYCIFGNIKIKVLRFNLSALNLIILSYHFFCCWNLIEL